MQVKITMEEEVLKKAKVYCIEHNTTLSKLISDLVTEKLGVSSPSDKQKRIEELEEKAWLSGLSLTENTELERLKRSAP